MGAGALRVVGCAEALGVFAACMYAADPRAEALTGRLRCDT